MENIFRVLTLLAGFHAYTYARWLKQKGNRLGWIGVLLLTAAGLGAAIYQMYTAL